MSSVSLISPFLQQSESIEGVLSAPIRVFQDERGQFMETFRREWFPWIDWSNMQSNRSDSRAGVLRGLHFHRRQVDYWYVTHGRIRVGMVDLRRSSRTYLATQTLEIGDDNNIGVFIPTGVAHGFLALTDVTLTYLVNQYYDGSDELGVAWNDPQLKIPWGIETPTLSPRDAANPYLCDIAAHLLPG